jgi:hypothetical protein
MAGTQFDPEVVAAFVSEVERRAAEEQDPTEVEAPLRAVAERVRSLLQTT